jgi:phage tail-like protein
MKFSYKVIAALLVLVIVTSIAAYAPTRRTEDFGDPIGNYNFRVEIAGVDAGQFASVEGLQVEIEVVEFQTGDDVILRKRPGRTTYTNIVLKKGYTQSTALNDWITNVRNGQYDRKDIAIILNDNAGGFIKQWNLFQAFPVRWTITPLDGMGDEALYEEIEIAYEYFEEG